MTIQLILAIKATYIMAAITCVGCLSRLAQDCPNRRILNKFDFSVSNSYLSGGVGRPQAFPLNLASVWKMTLSVKSFYLDDAIFPGIGTLLRPGKPVCSLTNHQQAPNAIEFNHQQYSL